MPAVRARAVAEGERRDHEVARCEVGDVGADVLDDADELVADRAGLERRVAAVVPEVRAADAGEHDAHDRVGRLDDDRVGPVAGLDRVGLVEDGCTHGLHISACSRAVGGPVKGVLAGHPSDAGALYRRTPIEWTHRGHERHRRVPDHPAGEDHARAGRPADLRQAARARACAARRSPRWPASASSTTSAWSAATPAASPSCVLEGARPRAAARRRRARPPVRPRPRRRATSDAPKRAGPCKQRIRPVVQRILDPIAAPATVRNARLDYLAANPLGRALYAPVFDSREQPANSARFTFLDPAAADFYPDWDSVANELVAHLRSEAGRNPYDRQPVRPHRRAVDAQRRVPRPLGRAQRALPPHRHQAHPPPRRRRPRPQLRGDGAPRRRRPERRRLHRRARLGARSRRSTCSPAGRRRRSRRTRPQQYRQLIRESFNAGWSAGPGLTRVREPRRPVAGGHAGHPSARRDPRPAAVRGQRPGVAHRHTSRAGCSSTRRRSTCPRSGATRRVISSSRASTATRWSSSTASSPRSGRTATPTSPSTPIRTCATASRTRSRVEARAHKDSRWYTGAGIYRDPCT